ncbi:NAD(P)/FAD-dependent oxidoreductase [Chitinophaga lutea]
MDTMTIEVAVIGGSSAGLAAALTLGRCGRQAVVFDGGAPRNKPAAHAQNFFTRDGTPPAELLRIGREQLAPYPSIRLHGDIVAQAEHRPEGFFLTTAAGVNFLARRIILATGVKDQLPDIPGLAALWGGKVFHCPFCHGWEARNVPIALLANGEAAADAATVIWNWNKDMLLCTNGPSTIPAERAAQLQRQGIVLLETPVTSIDDTPDGIRLHFADGTSAEKSVGYIKAPLIFQNGIARQLGCKLTESGSVEVDAMQATSVPGVFAAGDVAHPGMHQVSMAAATGHMAAAACFRGLNMEIFAG